MTHISAIQMELIYRPLQHESAILRVTAESALAVAPDGPYSIGKKVKSFGTLGIRREERKKRWGRRSLLTVAAPME